MRREGLGDYLLGGLAGAVIDMPETGHMPFL